MSTTEKPQAPKEPEEVGGVYTTDVEGVYSATKGGVPDPTVRPAGEEPEEDADEGDDGDEADAEDKK